MTDIRKKAVRKYDQEGAVSLLQSANRWGFNRVAESLSRAPLIHYHTALQYIREPNLDYATETKVRDTNFWLDRYTELKNFYEKDDREMAKFYWINGFPNSRYYRRKTERENEKYFGQWQGETPTSEELLNAYRQMHFYLSNRFMLGYHRYDIAEGYLSIQGADADSDGIHVLDYGCGVADPAIYLGVLGAETTVVDLDTKLLDFAEYRLEQRELTGANVIRAQHSREPVEIPENEFDCIIVSELLEHVKDPGPFLQAIIAGLKEGGVLYDSFGREYSHDVGDPQHLEEAKAVAESAAYRDMHESNFTSIQPTDYLRTRWIGNNYYRKS